MRLSALERKILNCIQEDIPLSRNPFKILSKKVGLKEEELLKRIRQLKERGLICNFSARLNHRKLKFKSTLIALRVPLNRVEALAKRISNLSEVTHCYLRKGDYNLWTVFVYRNRRLKRLLDDIAKDVGENNILNLPTKRQFKLKTKLKI